MTVRVTGETVPEREVLMYVNELVKAHPDKDISAVDIFVSGDSMKVRMLHGMGKSA